MARLYEIRNRLYKAPDSPFEQLPVHPGQTLSAVINMFRSEGVVPDLVPADLGVDDDTELAGDGKPLVDPFGDIRTDPMAQRERDLVSSSRKNPGIPDSFFDSNGDLVTPTDN